MRQLLDVVLYVLSPSRPRAKHSRCWVYIQHTPSWVRHLRRSEWIVSHAAAERGRTFKSRYADKPLSSSSSIIGRMQRFKALAYFSMVLMSLGSGLMIHFRYSFTTLGYVVMCQILIAAAAGIQTTTQYMAILTKAPHESVAIRVAILYLFIMIGSAIGTTVSGTIWTNSLRRYLVEFLPDGLKGEADRLYASLETQLSYEFGTPLRDATVSAYTEVQKLLTITATAMTVFAWIGVVLTKESPDGGEEQELEQEERQMNAP